MASYSNKLIRANKGSKKKKGDDEDAGEQDENQVTRDEIFTLLNLGNADGGIGAGKYG